MLRPVSGSSRRSYSPAGRTYDSAAAARTTTVSSVSGCGKRSLRTRCPIRSRNVDEVAMCHQHAPAVPRLTIGGAEQLRLLDGSTLARTASAEHHFRRTGAGARMRGTRLDTGTMPPPEGGMPGQSHGGKQLGHAHGSRAQRAHEPDPGQGHEAGDGGATARPRPGVSLPPARQGAARPPRSRVPPPAAR